jgi:hypothetical protein
MEASRESGKAEKTGWKAKKKKIEKFFKDIWYKIKILLRTESNEG